IFGGCISRKAAAVPPPPAYQGIIANDTSRLQESLFKGDQEVLSNDDIQRILTARITLTDRHRLAVLGLGTRFTYSQALADLDAQNSQRFLQAQNHHPDLPRSGETGESGIAALAITCQSTIPF